MRQTVLGPERNRYIGNGFLLGTERNGMKFYGNLWNSMKTNDILWTSMNFIPKSWNSMDINTILWNLMKFNEIRRNQEYLLSRKHWIFRYSNPERSAAEAAACKFATAGLCPPSLAWQTTPALGAERHARRTPWLTSCLMPCKGSVRLHD